MVTIEQNPQEIAAAQFRNAEMRLDALEKKEQALGPNGLAVNGARVAGFGVGLATLGAINSGVGGFMARNDLDSAMKEVSQRAVNAGFGTNTVSSAWGKAVDGISNAFGNDPARFKASNVAEVITKDFGDDMGKAAGKAAQVMESQGTRISGNLHQSFAKTFQNDKDMRGVMSKTIGGNKFTQGLASNMSAAWKNAGPIGRNATRAAVIGGAVVACAKVAEHLTSNKAELAKTMVAKEEALQDRNQAAAYIQQSAHPQERNWAQRVSDSRQQETTIGRA